MSDTEYQTDSQRTGGVVPGLAAPKLHNKLYKQATIMAAAIAQVLVSQGYDAKDGDLAALVASAKHALTLSVGGVKPDAAGNVPISVNGNVPDSAGRITVPSGITMNQIYPVGSVYFSTVKAFSPGTAFGGTWSLVEEGRFIRAAGSTVTALATGGADTVALSVDNLPPHSHSASCSSDGSHTHTGSTSTNGSHTHNSMGYGDGSSLGMGDTDWNNALNIPTSSAGDHYHTFTTNSAGSHSHTVTVNATGKGSAFSILPRWISMYIWRRTA